MAIVIAKEAEAGLPELVVRSANGEVVTMQYHVLPLLLLAEVQRVEKERAYGGGTHRAARGPADPGGRPRRAAVAS